MRTRAAVMFEPGRLEQRELDLDEPLEGEVVVRMGAVGVCGTDLHSYKGEVNRPTPIVLGHEGAGVVEAAGDGANGLRAGDRVVLSWAPARGSWGLPPRPAGRLRATLQRDRPRHPRRPHRPRSAARRSSAARRPGPGGTGRRRGGRGPAARRRRSARAGRAPRLRRADRCRRRAQRGTARARVHGARHRRRRRRPVRRPGSTDRGRRRDPRRRPGRRPARPGARAGRDLALRPDEVRGGDGSSTPKASTMPSTRSAPRRRRSSPSGGRAAAARPSSSASQPRASCSSSTRSTSRTGEDAHGDDLRLGGPRRRPAAPAGPRAIGRARAGEPCRPLLPARARTTRSRPASPASPAACSSFRRVVSSGLRRQRLGGGLT